MEDDDQRYVYFVEGVGIVKIGIAKNPYTRLAALQVGSPVSLRFLGFYPGGKKEEKALHVTLKGL